MKGFGKLLQIEIWAVLDSPIFDEILFNINGLREGRDFGEETQDQPRPLLH